MCLEPHRISQVVSKYIARLFPRRKTQVCLSLTVTELLEYEAEKFPGLHDRKVEKFLALQSCEPALNSLLPA